MEGGRGGPCEGVGGIVVIDAAASGGMAGQVPRADGGQTFEG